MANGFNVPKVNLSMYAPTGSQMQLSPVKNVLGTQQQTPYSSSGLSSILQGIQSRRTQPLGTSQTRFDQVAPASYMSPALVPEPTQQAAQKTLSPLDQLQAAQLRLPARGTPQGAGLSAAAQQLLTASGYTDKPLSMGQILGSAGAAYTEAEQAARDRAEEQRRQNLADQLALATFQLDVQKAMKPEDPTRPQVETFYDQATGLPYKAQWNPSTQSWDKVGGVKVGDSEQIYINPETGEVTITKGTGEAPEIASKTKGGLEETILSTDQTISSLTSARDMYNKSMSQFAPRFNMAVTNIKAGLGLQVSDEDMQEATNFVRTASRINEVFSKTLNELSGAAVSKQENTRILTSYGYLGSIANPFSGDSPIEFQSKLNNQINTLRSINIRAKLLLTGDKKITDDLSYKYPLDYTVDGNTIFFSDYIDDALDSNLAKTEIEAAELWANEISELRSGEAD